MRNLFILSILTSLTFSSLLASEKDSTLIKSKAPKVFIDCGRCDIDYIRTEITFVNYVIDRKNADIHILVTRERTGSGGREYTLTFLGQKTFADMTDTLTFVTQMDDTDDQIRKKLVKSLKIGLMRYVAQTPIGDQISISYTQPEKAAEVRDKWNYWVFRTRLRSYLNGEKSYKYTSLSGRFSADRITENWKIKLSASSYYHEDNFTYGDETISSYSRSHYLGGLIVKSISEHWSVGLSTHTFSSTYSNRKIAVTINPAIEYNIYPYSESTRRELRLLYRIGPELNYYNEETIYDKTKEKLLQEELSVELQFKQPWGSVESEISGSHYFHDFEKNHLRIRSEISLRLFKGFSLEAWGGFSMIHDQLSLPQRDISREEILLQRRELETQYNYWGSIGFSYTFGAIYNNIVNPLFGN